MSAHTYVVGNLGNQPEARFTQNGIDAMEPVWGTQDTIWAGETPGQRERRREAGGAVHRPRRVHVTPGPEAGDWLTTRIPNARRKVRL